MQNVGGDAVPVPKNREVDYQNCWFVAGNLFLTLFDCAHLADQIRLSTVVGFIWVGSAPRKVFRTDPLYAGMRGSEFSVIRFFWKVVSGNDKSPLNGILRCPLK